MGAVRYILRLIKQRELWDDYMQSHPQSHLLQSWGWGEIKQNAGWHPLRLALWDNQKQQIVAAAQVLRRTAPHVPLWAGHLAYIPKGPVLDWSQPQLVKDFFAHLHPYLRRQGALALRLEPAQAIDAPDQPALSAVLAAMHFHSVTSIQPLRTIVLNLTPNEATLLAQMKEKWRYNVRLAARKGVTIRVAQTEEDVRAWYAIMQTTSERDQFGIHTLDYYLSAWQALFPCQQARLFLADYERQVLAGIFVGLMARQAIYLYGASSNEQRNLMPNYLLQWEAIRWAKEAGATSYDFWGIPETDETDEAMAGVYRFKAGWGGQIARFIGCYERLYRPLTMRIINRFLSI